MGHYEGRVCVGWPGRPLRLDRKLWGFLGSSFRKRTDEAPQTSPKSVRTGCTRDLKISTGSLAGHPRLTAALTTYSASRGARSWSWTCWPRRAPRSEPSGQTGEGAGAAGAAAGR